MEQTRKQNIIMVIIMSIVMLIPLTIYIGIGLNYLYAVSILFFSGICLAVYLIKYKGNDIETFRNKSLAGFSVMIKMLILLGAIIEYNNGTFMATNENRTAAFVVHYLMVYVLCILELFMFMKKTNSIKFKHLVLGDFFFVYLVFATSIESFWVLVTGITLLTSYTIYGSKKLINITAVGVNLINSLSVVKRVSSFSGENKDYYMYIHIMEIIVMIIYTLVLVYSSEVIKKMNEERILFVEKEEEKVKGLIFQIKKIGKKVKENVLFTNKVVNELEMAINSSVNVLNDIAESSNQNMASVDEQAEMSCNITDMITGVVKEVGETLLISNKSMAGVHNGKLSFQNIKNKSNNIVENNREVQNTIAEFVRDTQYVKDITKGIADISEQTNLLSLNASIKSARAGEDGKGFSVVANEIRKLAFETTKLTDNINEIFIELEENAKIAQDMVNEVVEAVNKENIDIDVTVLDFDNLEENINLLSKNVDFISNKMEQVSIYNNKIGEHVTNLSASGEEVLAYTEEVLILNNENNKKTIESKELLNELMETVEGLNMLGEN